jgi:hypothetical protein
LVANSSKPPALKHGLNAFPTAHHITTMRCPHCGHIGTLDSVGNVPDAAWASVSGLAADWFAGVRCCPNPECQRLIFVVFSHSALVASYPPEVLDFDSSNIPPLIAASLEEAIKCHSVGAFRGAALLVRRTLEELCADRKAEGTDLKKRIAALASVMTVPPDLLAAADHLRLLGNDAAHIEAKTYDEIGKKEVELAIELAKELLKAAYQYASLVARLAAFRRTPAPSRGP